VVQIVIEDGSGPCARAHPPRPWRGHRPARGAQPGSGPSAAAPPVLPASASSSCSASKAATRAVVAGPIVWACCRARGRILGQEEAASQRVVLGTGAAPVGDTDVGGQELGAVIDFPPASHSAAPPPAAGRPSPARNTRAHRHAPWQSVLHPCLGAILPVPRGERAAAAGVLLAGEERGERLFPGGTVHALAGHLQAPGLRRLPPRYPGLHRCAHERNSRARTATCARPAVCRLASARAPDRPAPRSTGVNSP